MLCSARMQDRLPIEVREIIYTEIWDLEYLDSTRPQSLQSRSHDCVGTRCQPHIVRSEFMGKDTALEMAQAWYEAAARLTPDTFTISDTQESIREAVCKDPFQIGLDPATVLRTLTIAFDEDTSRMENLYSKWTDADTRRKSLDPLYRIRKKAGFRLTFRICTIKFRLNRWPELLDFFRPVVEMFEEEKAIVDVQAVHRSRGGAKDTPYVYVDLNDIVRGYDAATWKESVIKYLDGVIPILVSSRKTGADK
jgi:hypothetical protein